jgi:hypothetical protein
MNPHSNTVDDANALQPPLVLCQDETQRGNYPLLSLSSLAPPDSTYPHNTQSNVPIDIGPPVTTAEFVSPPMLLSMPPVIAGTINHHTASSSTRAQHTKKNHPCRQCGKAFTRRELAGGCENRHQNLRPFLCTKHCGDPNW